MMVWHAVPSEVLRFFRGDLPTIGYLPTLANYPQSKRGFSSYYSGISIQIFRILIWIRPTSGCNFLPRGLDYGLLKIAVTFSRICGARDGELPGEAPWRGRYSLPEFSRNESWKMN